MKKTIFLSLVCALFVGLFVVPSLTTRWGWEKDNTVEICLDGEEVLALGQTNDEGVLTFLTQAEKIGVSSLSVYWDIATPLETRLAEWTPRLPPKMSITLRPQVAPFSAPAVFPSLALSAPVTRVLFAGLSLPGYPGMGPVVEGLSSFPGDLPWIEFSHQQGLATVQRAFPNKTIRAHSINEDEMEILPLDQVIRRYRRAVKERGVRFLYVRLFPNFSVLQNQSFLEQLSVALKGDGFPLGVATPRYGNWTPSRSGPLRQILAFLVSVLGPLIGFFVAVRIKGHRGLLVLFAVSILSALSVAACLSTPDFMLGFSSFHGVKASFFLPLLIGSLALWPMPKGWRGNSPLDVTIQPRREGNPGFPSPLGRGEGEGPEPLPLDVESPPLQRGARGDLPLPVASLGDGDFVFSFNTLWQKPVTVGGLVLISLVLTGAVYLLLRTGHGTVADATGWELLFRERLESFFGVRPRFKEFLIGYPCLWLGFSLKDRRWSRPLLLIGLVGPLSLINTYCHAHTPLAVSFLRSFHGLWLGTILGLLLTWGVKRYHR